MISQHPREKSSLTRVSSLNSQLGPLWVHHAASQHSALDGTVHIMHLGVGVDLNSKLKIEILLKEQHFQRFVLVNCMEY